MTPQRIYLAGPYGLRQYLKDSIAPVLRKEGHHITSSWINDPAENDKVADYLRSRKRGEGHRIGHYDDILAHEALRDVIDIEHSTMLMRFESSDLTPSGGGKFWETGLAFGLGLHIVVVGKRETVFDYLPLGATWRRPQSTPYVVMDTFADALRYMKDK